MRFHPIPYLLKIHIVLVLVGVLLAPSAQGQIEQPGTITGLPATKAGFSYFELPAADFYQEQVHNRRHKIARVGKVYNVQIDLLNELRWKLHSNGMRVGHFGLTAENASSLGLNFFPYELIPGCKIFVYNPAQNIQSGAFTYRNNKSSQYLSLNPIQSDSLILEIQLAPGVEAPGSLVLESVCVGFAEHPDISYSKSRYGLSAACHVDVSCLDDSRIQNQKYATARLYTVRNDTGIYCSGTLVNSVGNTGLPYFLTAGHCIEDEYEAHRSVVLFDYESPFCDGPDGNTMKSISGALLKARNNDLDFALVELTTRPPVNYYPLYAGWDLSNTIPQTTYAIHHPQGDVKKLAIDSSGLVNENAESGNPSFYWQVPGYEMGTTEGGSSGSALFDEENQIVGILSGGGFACDEYIYDYYQKFNIAWEAYAESDMQLKYWLNPDASEVYELDTYNPFAGITEQLSNVEQYDEYTLVEYAPWGYASGHNARYTRKYQEHYYRNGTKYVYAVTLKVLRAYPANPESTLRLQIRNGDSEQPAEVLFEKELYISELSEGSDNYIRLDTLVEVNQDFYVGYEIAYNTAQDTFAVEVASKLEENSAWMLDNDGWYPLRSGRNELNASLGVFPHVLDYYPQNSDNFSEFLENDLNLYPNPATEHIQLLFKEAPEGVVDIRIYDAFGRMVQNTSYKDMERNIRLDIQRLQKSGIYLLQVNYAGGSLVEKFICLR